MATGPYAPRPPGSLKAAIAALITACGGVERAAELGARTASRMHAYGDAAQPERQMPIDVVRRLEAAAGVYPVTAFLAAEAGFVLSRPSGAAAALPSHLAEVARDGAEVVARTALALGDGIVTRDEAGPLIDAVDAAQEGLAAMRATLAHVRDGGND